LVLACWQAFQARDIKSEFSEATYIGLAVFSLSQAIVTGIPIMVIVKDIPEAFYLVSTFLVFVLCMVVLLLIFLPKVFMDRSYASMSKRDQKLKMALSVRMSSIQHHHGSNGDLGFVSSPTSGFVSTAFGAPQIVDQTKMKEELADSSYASTSSPQPLATAPGKEDIAEEVKRESTAENERPSNDINTNTRTSSFAMPLSSLIMAGSSSQTDTRERTCSDVISC
jgi:hypothetical protein